MKFSQADIANAMQTLELPDQVVVLESLVAEVGIEQSADVIALHLMSIMLDLEGGNYPVALVARVERLTEQVRMFNEARFAPENGK